MPPLRQALVTKELVIEGVNSPAPHIAFSNAPAPEQPTPIASDLQIHPGEASVSPTGAAPRQMPAPSAAPVVAASVAPVTPITRTPTLTTQKPSENTKEKCGNFLANLVNLSRKEPKSVQTNVRNLVQELIDARVEPEVFCDRLERLLNAIPQPCLLGFLKKNLPPLRQALVTKELVIEGINSPAPHIAFPNAPAPEQPTPITSDLQIKRELLDGAEPETMFRRNEDENPVIKEEEVTEPERQPEQKKNGTQGGEQVDFNVGSAIRSIGAAATPGHSPKSGDMRNQKRQRNPDAVSPATSAAEKKVKPSNSIWVPPIASGEAEGVDWSYANGAAAHLIVVVLQSDDLKMDEMRANILRQELESLSFTWFANHKDDKPLWMPRFKELPSLASGGLRIHCVNNQSLDWLKSQVDQLKGLWDGCPGYYIMQESLIPKYTRGKICVPDFSEGDVGVLKDYLAAMNMGEYDINMWPLLASKTEKVGPKQNITLMVGIPPADLLKLKEGGCCLYYKLATVSVSLCENKNDQPPDSDT